MGKPIPSISSARLPSRPGGPFLPPGSNAVQDQRVQRYPVGIAADAEGSFAPRPQGGDRKSGRIEAEAAFILARVAETPDTTLAELQTRLSARGLDVGIGTLWRFFNRRQISFKKTAHAAEQERADVAAAREAWFAAQIDLDPETCLHR